MGISTLRGYRHSQTYEAFGLNETFVKNYFPGTPSRIGGIGLKEIEAETLERHFHAFEDADELIVTLVQFIPVIGWFIATPIFGFLALGAAILSGFGTSVDWMLQRSEIDPVPRPAVR